MLDKKNLLNQLIVTVKSELEKQQKSFESARHASIDAPGRMQSRYDTMGIEAAWLADGLSKSLDEKKSQLERLYALNIDEPSLRVSIGSIVGITVNNTPDMEYFFILPVLSGYELNVNKVTITTLSPETPIGKALIGKRVGEKISMNDTNQIITLEVLL